MVERGCLRLLHPCEHALNGLLYIGFQCTIQRGQPESHGEDGVGGDVGGAAVEGKSAPSLAESGHATVTVLQPHQPSESLLNLKTGLALGEMMEGNQCTAGVIAIGHRTAEVAPPPSTRSCCRERMHSGGGCTKEEGGELRVES